MLVDGGSRTRELVDGLIARGVLVRDRSKDPHCPRASGSPPAWSNTRARAAEALEALCGKRSSSARRRETSIASRCRSTARAASRITPASAFSITCSIWSPGTAAFDLKVAAKGDLDVDQHHTVEDVGIALGEAVSQALGDAQGINRAGYFVMPMDETLAVAAIDLSGRPHTVVQTKVTVRLVGDLQTELVHRLLRRLRHGRARQRARQGDVRALESSQDRGLLQGVRPRAARRVREGSRAWRRCCRARKGCCDRADRLRRRQSHVGAQGAVGPAAPSSGRHRTPIEIARATAIIVPGVGHFAATRTMDGPWRDAIRAAVDARQAAARHLSRHAVAVQRQQ